MTGQDEHLPPDDEADLAALADGSLYGPRRADVEKRLKADAALAEALERQRAAVAMIAAAGVPAPLALRARVGELQQAARARRRRLLPAVALAFAATVAAFVVLLAARGPGVEDVLAVAVRPATAPAALDREFEGIRFPRYGGWRATGSRTDTVGGRAVRTVFYRRDGRSIAYAIVAGPALSDEPQLRTLREAGQAAVTWTRAGRTCVIVGDDPKVLARLAVW